MRGWTFGVIAFAIVIYFLVEFSLEVDHLGKNTGSGFLRADWFIALGWSFVLGLLIALAPFPRGERCILIILWAFRVFIGLVASLWYEAHYDFLDSFSYFSQSKGDWGDWAIGLGSGTENIYALCWLHQQVFPECYHTMKVSFAAVGLAGLWWFYLAAKTAFPHIFTRKFLLFAGIIPSVVFWSSIIGKDPLMFAGIGLYAYGVCHLSVTKEARAWWFIALGVGLAAMIRLWVGPVLCLPLIYLILRDVSDVRLRVFYGLVAIAAMAGAMSLTLDLFNVSSTQDAVYQANQVSREWARGGSAQVVDDIESITDLGMALPWWMFSFLFRPFPGEVDNAFGLLSGIEGACFLLVCVWSLFRFRRQDWRLPLVRWAMLLVLGYVGLFSIAGYQNLGTAVRWRLPMTPFLAAFVVYAIRARHQEGYRQRAVRGLVDNTGNDMTPSAERPRR